MSLLDKAGAVARSAHAGRAMKLAKVLNFVGTVRGAVTTVLLAASAIGGAATVNTVRQEVAERPSANPARALVRPSATPTASPLTAAALQADAQRRLEGALAQDSAAIDDLRKVAVLQGTALDTLIELSKQKLQARYDAAITQVGGLLAPPSAAPSGTPAPSPSLSVIAVNAIVQIALNDMGAIVVNATRLATEPGPILTPRPATPPPTPLRTPSPPPRTASPTIRPTPTPTPTH